MVYDRPANRRWKYVPKGALPVTISLTCHDHHGALCLLRVYALYGRSHRILGLLLFVGMGSVVTTLVGRLPLTLMLVYACPNIFYYLSRCYYSYIVTPGLKRF